jgi:intein-encoded DNA endonuclease-like protein
MVAKLVLRNGPKTDVIIKHNYYTYEISHNFFKNWTSQMAYILGFIFADGNIDKNNVTLAFEQQVGDKEILEKIRTPMASTHKIETTKKGKYVRLRINSRQLIFDLKKLGVTHNKSKYCICPKIPNEFLSHFLRGFIDGDGWVVTRTKNNRHEINVGFCHGCKDFLLELIRQLQAELHLTTNNLRTRLKTTRKGNKSTVYQIDWHSHNAIKLLDWLYKDADIFLSRKYNKYLQGRKLFEEYSLKTALWRRVEAKYNKPLKQVLSELHNKNLNTYQIAKEINASKSQTYRFLIKTGVIDKHK